MLHILTLFLISTSILTAFDFSHEKFLQKLEEPIPKWMQEQITEDFAFFRQTGWTSEDLERTLSEVHAIPSGKQACFVRYQIKDNIISVSSPFEQLEDARIQHVKEVLEDIAKVRPLPDVDFLMSIWDSYDNPLFLEHTHCPVLTICKLKTNRCGVLFPEFRHFSYRKRLFADINWACDHSCWSEKKPQAFWRGMSSGWNYSLDKWDFRPRARLALFSKAHPHLVDAAFTSPYALDAVVENWMRSYELFQPWAYPVEFVKYKYLISIDGNTFASNLWWQLLSNCTVLKGESDFIEWFYKGISPDVHYIPFSQDTSDLEEVVMGCINNDQRAKDVAERGSVFAKEHLTNEGLMVYCYRVLEAYANLQTGSKLSQP